MRSTVLAVFLAGIALLLLEPLQRKLRGLLKNQHARIWAVPFLLTGIFAACAALAGVYDLRLILLVLGYTAAPVGAARWSPLLATALLWLPMEFAVAAHLVPRAAQGFLHSVGYGVAILLALALFVAYRPLAGMKYNLPQRFSDLWLPFVGFALVAPVLIVVGLATGFIPWPHLPHQAGSRMAAAAGIIFVGTALPEEILFRALIQNLLMHRLGGGTATLILASVIFGLAHLDNGPQAVPNWRYAIVATIAGYAYGRVFQKASTVLSSAGLHTLVNWTKHMFF
jgi:membrane protease YdiL (CAAX protease family)